MMNRLGWIMIASLLLHAPMARGEAPVASSPPPGLPDGAAGDVEVSVALGHAQAYGRLGRGLPTLNDMGWAVDVALGWRLDRDWMVGPYGSSGAASSLGNLNLSYSAAAGLQVTRRLPHDGWAALGVGWRGLWASDTGPRASYQGLELARLQLGFDSAVSPTLSFSPVLGATLTTYLQEKSGFGNGYHRVIDPRVSVSLFAGLLMRFEVLPR